MNSPIKIPGANISGASSEKLQISLLALENKFKSGEVSGLELQERNAIIDELKTRTVYIDSLAHKHASLDKDRDRLDGTGRKFDQDELMKEMGRIMVILNLLGYDTLGKPLKSPEIKLQVSGKVSQLTFAGFEGTARKRRTKK